MRSDRLGQVLFVFGGTSPFIKQLFSHLQVKATSCRVVSTLAELLRFTYQSSSVFILEEGFAQMRLENLVCRLRRNTTAPLAVVLNSSCKNEVRRWVLLEIGVDRILEETMIKTAASHLLAMFRRHKGIWPITEERIEYGPLVILPKEHLVEAHGQKAKLTKKELEIFLYLVPRDNVVPRAELYQAVWGNKHPTDSRTLDSHISRIRQKIERNPHRPELLLIIPCVGYTLLTS